MSSDPPSWWREPLAEHVQRVVQAALPNEAGGLVYIRPGDAEPLLHVFDGCSTPVSFTADVDQVVAFAFALTEEGGTVLGTFHSHPRGARAFSERDGALGEWARMHVVLPGRPDGGWDACFYTTRDL